MLSSVGEKTIHNILLNHSIPFAEEFEFAELRTQSGRPLRFDFCVFKKDGTIDYLIEFNGRQHYEPVSYFGGKKGLSKQKFNDKRKRDFCKKNNLTLVVIPYWEEHKISYDYLMQKAGY